MNKKKKLLSVILCAALVFALAVPAFAAISPSSARRIYAWGGAYTGGSLVGLAGNGIDQIVTVRNSANGGGNTWTVTRDELGRFLIQDNISNGYINVYRVLQPNGYYNCTLRPAEDAYRDEYVRVEAVGETASKIRLYAPQMGGTWYMVTDRSAPSPTSDVIWYTNGGTQRALWY